MTLGEKLKRELRNRTRSLRAGAKFPTEAELCTEFSVSRMTMNKAIMTLVDEGILVRYPRRGTFVRKPPEQESIGLEHGFDGGFKTIFDVRRKLRLHLSEYAHPFMRPAWDAMLDELRNKLPGLDFEVLHRPEESAGADVIWGTMRENVSSPTVALFADSEEARDALDREPGGDDFFAIGRIGKYAARPFELSTSLNLWNRRLLAEHGFPEQTVPTGLVSFLLKNAEWRRKNFPPVVSYLFCPLILLQWVTEGAVGYDPESGQFDLSRPLLKEYLEFNRVMYARISRISEKFAPGCEAGEVLKMLIGGEILAVNTFSPQLKHLPDGAPFAASSQLVGNAAPVIPIYLGIGRECRMVSLAARVVAHLCGPEVGRIIAGYHRNIPACRSAAYSQEFLSAAPLGMREILEMLDRAGGIINPKHFFNDGNLISETLGRCIIGELSIPELEQKIIQIRR